MNVDDTVGHTFKRAFYRVDGLTMYFFVAAWVLRPVLFGRGETMEFVVCGMLATASPILYIILAIGKNPGLVTAAIIAVFNLWIMFG